MIRWSKKRRIGSLPLKEVMTMTMTTMITLEVVVNSKNKLTSTQIKVQMEQNVNQR